MRLAEIFALVLIASMCSSSDARKREKRTLGTFLQFFGFKLVPLSENVNKLPQPEKYQSLAQTQTQRTPRLNRIQTVMPFASLEENSSSELTTESETTSEATASEAPTLRTTFLDLGELVGEDLKMNNADGEPLRIVLEDPPSTAPAPTDSAEDSFAKIEQATEEPSTEANEAESSTSAPNEDISSSSNANIQVESSSEAVLETSSEIPSENFSGVRSDVPEEIPPFRPLPNFIDQNRINDNFEFYRSNDETNRFFNQQDYSRTFGVYPQHQAQHVLPPRPFARPQIVQHPFYQQPNFQHPQYLPPNVHYPQYQPHYLQQRSNDRLSTSSTAMKINGKEHFNYQTYHR